MTDGGCCVASARHRPPTKPATLTAMPKVRPQDASSCRVCTLGIAKAPGGIACEKAFIGTDTDCDTKPDAQTKMTRLRQLWTLHYTAVCGHLSCAAHETKVGDHLFRLH